MITVTQTQMDRFEADDILKTVTCTLFDSFELIRMSFGLRNAAQTFQCFLDTVFRGLPFFYCYLLLIENLRKVFVM